MFIYLTDYWLFIYLFTYLFYLFIYLFDYLSFIYLFTFLLFYLFISLTNSLHYFFSIYLSIQCIYVFIHSLTDLFFF